MKIGFIGTRDRNAINPYQGALFAKLIRGSYYESLEEFHHGGRVGADMFADWFIKELNLTHPVLVVHPSTLSNTWGAPWNQVVLQINPYKEIWAPDDPINRNHVIVDKCNFLYAIPRTNHEELRSGTWATIRYAQKVGRKGVVIYPDGTTEEF